MMEIQDRFKVLALEKDEIMIPEVIEKTFAGSGIPVEIEDFAFPYSHENPFPLNSPDTMGVNNGLESVMTRAANFFS